METEISVALWALVAREGLQLFNCYDGSQLLFHHFSRFRQPRGFIHTIRLNSGGNGLWSVLTVSIGIQ